MSGAASKQTIRSARVDDGYENRVEFARQTIDAAREAGETELVWHFASKDAATRVSSGSSKLGALATTLARNGQVKSNGLTISLATPRLDPKAGYQAPLACWWASDKQLLRLEAIHLPRIDALISHGYSAPIWMTAFEVALESEPVGVLRAGSGIAGQDPIIDPIEVSSDLVTAIVELSAVINPTNGIHDSLAGPLIDYLRGQLRSGQATPDVVAVAALRAGWRPEQLSALLDRVAG